MFAEPDDARLSLLSRTGPEMPPDVVVDEPTRILPVMARRPPGVSARAVIVYETAPRRPWRLWVFTATIVALTVGVILGQAVADQPATRTASAAEVPAVVEPPTTPAPPQPGARTPSARVTAPLGSIRKRLLVVTGAPAVLRIHSARLGGTLFSVTTPAGGPPPTWAGTRQGTHLELTGTTRADLELNAAVAWTVRLTGGAPAQDLDLRAGGLAALQLTGGNSVVSVRLPKPRGRVPITITGTVSRLTVSASAGTLVRLGSAEKLTFDGVRERAPFTPPGWTAAADRYDLVASTIGSVSVTHR